MSREDVVQEQAARVLAEIERLQVELDAGSLTVSGSTGQPKSHPLLSELRSHRWLLLRMLSEGPAGSSGPPAADAVDDLRRAWESASAV